MMNTMTSNYFDRKSNQTGPQKGSSDRIIDMLAFSGHELNNVLSRVLLNVEWLMQDPDSKRLSERQLQVIHSLHQNASLLRGIARSYIALARLEDKSLAFNATPVDPVVQIIEPLVTGYAEILREQKQTCELRLSGIGISIFADLTLMTSVFDNLLNNAVKYGEQESTILITLERSGDFVEVCFTNRAQGVDPDTVNQMFDRFARGSNTGHKSGSGIGLYLVKQVVEGHSGTFRAEATRDGEVKFTVSLPAHLA